MTDDNASNQLFATRLGQAIERLSAQRRQAIEQEMSQRGLEGGIKGGLAHIVGMSRASTLSDMLSGHTGLPLSSGSC